MAASVVSYQTSSVPDKGTCSSAKCDSNSTYPAPFHGIVSSPSPRGLQSRRMETTTQLLLSFKTSPCLNPENASAVPFHGSNDADQLVHFHVTALQIGVCPLHTKLTQGTQLAEIHIGLHFQHVTCWTKYVAMEENLRRVQLKQHLCVPRSWQRHEPTNLSFVPFLAFSVLVGCTPLRHHPSPHLSCVWRCVTLQALNDIADLYALPIADDPEAQNTPSNAMTTAVTMALSRMYDVRAMKMMKNGIAAQLIVSSNPPSQSAHGTLLREHA